MFLKMNSNGLQYIAVLCHRKKTVTSRIISKLAFFVAKLLKHISMYIHMQIADMLYIDNNLHSSNEVISASFAL